MINFAYEIASLKVFCAYLLVLLSYKVLHEK